MKKFRCALFYWNTWKFWLWFHSQINYGGVIWIDWATAKKLAAIIHD